MLFTRNVELCVPKEPFLSEEYFPSLSILSLFVLISTQGLSLTVLESYFDDWPLAAREIIVTLSLSIFVLCYFEDS